MFAGIVQEAGVLIGAVAALVIALAVAYGFISSKFDKISAQLGDVHVTAEAAKTTVTAVNNAVNNVPDGTPNLLERVTQIADSLAEHVETTEAWRADADARLTRIEDHITRPSGARKKAS